MFIACVLITTVLYMLIVYVSYITSRILYQGLVYRLIVPVIKSSVFIIVSYISIISDVILFYNFMYDSILTKNGMLLLLIGASLISAVRRKETKS
ncbi:putative membrane bound protein [Bacillus phage vB_BspH_Mawwa]|nr:putative membrane bound protein [Bacillus phage vB_BspH_Mawwa]